MHRFFLQYIICQITVIRFNKQQNFFKAFIIRTFYFDDLFIYTSHHFYFSLQFYFFMVINSIIGTKSTLKQPSIQIFVENSVENVFSIFKTVEKPVENVENSLFALFQNKRVSTSLKKCTESQKRLHKFTVISIIM